MHVNAAEGFNDRVRRTIVGTLPPSIEEQGAATNEIARSVQQAAGGTQGVSNNIGQVTQPPGKPAVPPAR
ncbi:hypothetical protein [Azospirillum thermophilum]|uniref:hypothetical protein n=1 Tax=Azospirillum thermophilum TaxID=2202148 RepID=UPI0015E8D215